jgi:hypothetical protein
MIHRFFVIPSSPNLDCETQPTLENHHAGSDNIGDWLNAIRQQGFQHRAVLFK